MPGHKHCVACRRYRERLKYHSNEAFRETKKAYQRQWRKDFFAAHGYWHCNLFENQGRKPKEKAA